MTDINIYDIFTQFNGITRFNKHQLLERESLLSHIGTCVIIGDILFRELQESCYAELGSQYKEFMSELINHDNEELINGDVDYHVKEAFNINTTTETSIQVQHLGLPVVVKRSFISRIVDMIATLLRAKHEVDTGNIFLEESFESAQSELFNLLLKFEEPSLEFSKELRFDYVGIIREFCIPLLSSHQKYELENHRAMDIRNGIQK